jgi:hypothetical protein
MNGLEEYAERVEQKAWDAMSQKELLILMLREQARQKEDISFIRKWLRPKAVLPVLFATAVLIGGPDAAKELGQVLTTFGLLGA